ncbi:hypothetical protein FACS1894122_13300 [Alphaproteobacteria bacterium]|nr:hypothetical protein FACS1894122_13300 [Alphaproteobacteria bacterium]
MFPSPNKLHPLIDGLERTCFLKNIITRPNIIIGDYTYYDDVNDVYNFEKNVLYHLEAWGDKLIIGKFCQIASGIKFLMNAMFHNASCCTTFPFSLFLDELSKKYQAGKSFPTKGDTLTPPHNLW